MYGEMSRISIINAFHIARKLGCLESHAVACAFQILFPVILRLSVAARLASRPQRRRARASLARTSVVGVYSIRRGTRPSDAAIVFAFVFSPLTLVARVFVLFYVDLRAYARRRGAEPALSLLTYFR